MKGNFSKQKQSSVNKTFDRLWYNAMEGNRYKDLIHESEFNTIHPFRPNLHKTVKKTRNRRNHVNSKKFSKGNLIARDNLEDVLQLDNLNKNLSSTSNLYRNKSQMDVKTRTYSPAQKKHALEEGNLYKLAYPYDDAWKQNSLRRHSCMSHNSRDNGMNGRDSIYSNTKTSNEKFYSKTNNGWFQPRTLSKSNKIYDQSTWFERSLSRTRCKYLENRKGFHGLAFKTNDLKRKTVSSIQDNDFRQTFVDKDGKLQQKTNENKFSKLIGLTS